MKVFQRGILFFLLAIASFATQKTYAQTNTNTTKSQERFLSESERRDSILTAAKEQKRLDSLNQILQKEKLIAYRDSMRAAAVEKRQQDSLQREEIKAGITRERATRDSLRAVQQEELKQMIAARKQTADSLRAARQATSDSLAQERNKTRKAREALQKYKASKGYKDSVAFAQQEKKDSINQARSEILATINAERKRVLDSTKAARSEQIAAIKAERTSIADSTKAARTKQIAEIKAERSRILDSTKAARTQQIADMKAEQSRILDSTKSARVAYMDSLKKARTETIDALKLARTKSKDSLEKERSQEKIVTKRNKTETELLKEQADKIHARKKGSYSNEELLKKSWNIKRRIWQNTVTRYNSYYNAKRKFDDAYKRLTDRYRETFTEQISLYPYNLESGLGAIGSDMDTVVKKCAYDSQIHDPRSKWFDNIYLLMGKAFYFKNDYEGAITAFQYVVNEYKDGDKNKKQKRGYVKTPALNEIKFDKNNKIKLANKEKRNGLKITAHHPIRNEALVWLAKAYIHNKQFSEGQSLLNILEEDPNFPDRLKDQLYFALAELNFAQGNDMAAIEPLEKALKQKSISKEMKNRTSYLIAQLYAKDGNLAKSNQYFNEALKNKMPVEMEYFTKLHLAQNAIEGNGDQNQAIEQLETLARNDKFTEWRPQTYLSLGQILQNKQPEEAIKYYDKCLSEENNSNLQAAAFLGKGQIYYDLKKYREAKSAYDSTLVFAKQAAPQLKNMAQISLRKEVLESLVTYSATIETEDSLQALSKMSEKEQLAVAKEELKRLQQVRKQELQAESEKLIGSVLQPGKFDKDAWYFYKNTSIQQGLVEFKMKWGDRQLVDDWRRSGSKALGGSVLTSNQADGSSTNKNENDLGRNAEALKLLADLYKTPADFKKSDKKIQDAYFQLALIYSSRLQEYARSIETLEALNLRYTNHDQLAATYYSMILSHQKLNQTAQEKVYEAKLKNEFPSTPFTELVNGTSAASNEQVTAVEQRYDSAYAMLQRADYNNALRNATASLAIYPENLLKSKFELVKARSWAGLKNYDSSIAVTEDIIKGYPGTKEQQYAQDFLAYLQKASALKPGLQEALNGNTTDTSNSMSESTQKNDPTAIYTKDKAEEHYYILLLSKIDGSTVALKAGFSDYNRMQHSAKTLKTNMNLIDRNSGVLSIVEFKNADFAERYAVQARNERNLFSQVNPGDFKAMIISKSNFRELLKTRKVEEYLKFYKDNY